MFGFGRANLAKTLLLSDNYDNRQWTADLLSSIIAKIWAILTDLNN
jgi:hypothetical protein